MRKSNIVADNVKRIFNERKITQKEFCAAHGLNYKNINNKLNGYVFIVPEDIEMFCAYLGVDANELFKSVA